MSAKTLLKADDTGNSSM